MAGIDNFRAGVVLAEHLIARGCTSLAFVHRPRSAGTTQARAAGFRAVLVTHGLVTAGRVIEAEPEDRELVRRLTGELRVDGIVCGNDYTAAHLLKNLQTAGVRIPEQIRLAGVDNVKYAQLLSVPLTTLAQPCRDIGLAALELMRFRIDHPKAPPRQILIDASLIQRESTA
jgi:LacI family transcriptional regulator